MHCHVMGPIHVSLNDCALLSHSLKCKYRTMGGFKSYVPMHDHIMDPIYMLSVKIML